MSDNVIRDFCSSSDNKTKVSDPRSSNLICSAISVPYNASKTCLRALHAQSRQPRGKENPVCSTWSLYGDFGFDHILKIEYNNTNDDVKRSVSLFDGDVTSKMFQTQYTLAANIWTLSNLDVMQFCPDACRLDTMILRPLHFKTFPKGFWSSTYM
jgi:hypothetical protein